MMMAENRPQFREPFMNGSTTDPATKGLLALCVDAGDGKILARTDYDDATSCSSIIASNYHLFIRTTSKLTCIDK